MQNLTKRLQSCFNSSTIYKPSEISDILRRIGEVDTSRKIRAKTAYLDVPCCFDIETTSTRTKDGEKFAFMYVWQFSIAGYVVMGRTWGEFVEMLDKISDYYATSEKLRLVIYCHNLSFEFQFLYKYFEWETVFPLGQRKPGYALTNKGLEFRCSYVLSGYSLAKLGEQLTTYTVHKMTGDLDYRKIRHEETPLTAKEIKYCVSDVQTVVAYIAERMIEAGGIAKIPLTNTGYVRQYVRGMCSAFPGYSEFVRNLTISPDEYKQLHAAFAGGFTHANRLYADEIMENVTSFDFTSSYPAVMVSEKYPMSKSEKIQIKDMQDFEYNLRTYCCLFDVELNNIKLKDGTPDSPLSLSHCWHHVKAKTDNGRIFEAEQIRTTCTETDFQIYRAFYDFDHIKVANFRRYMKGYLPKPIFQAVYEMYIKKTKLKDVDDKKAEYQHAKGQFNSLYGMIVINPVQEHGEFDTEYTEWKDADKIEKKPLADIIDEYNRAKSRFLFYPWGVWVTAYARRNLFSGILEMKDDYIYSDTDSIKCINAEKHEEYIARYNKKITEKLNKALDFHGLLGYYDTAPETIKGKKKPLGVWDFDGHYKRFKTLGAKRYMTEDDSGKVNITVSGLNKTYAVPYICTGWAYDITTRKENNSPFNMFSDGMEIPADYTGKQTHTYIDDPKTAIITDYTGRVKAVKALTGVHLENAPYDMTLSEYLNFIAGIKRIK